MHESHVDDKEQKPISMSWDIKTRDDRERGDVFYLVVLGFMAVLLIFAVWQKNFLFGIFVILATGVVLFLSTQQAETHSFKLTETELIIDGYQHLPYEKYSHFDVVEYHEQEYELYFAPKERLRSMVRARIWKNDIEKIETFLKIHLPKKKIEPSLSDLFSKLLGI